MYQPGQRKIIHQSGRMKFRSRHTDELLELILLFVSEVQPMLAPNKLGVRIQKESIVPQGMQLFDRGTLITPGDEHLIEPDIGNITVKDLDGRHYELFTVELVHARRGGVLYFASEPAFRGLLAENPQRNLEKEPDEIKDDPDEFPPTT